MRDALTAREIASLKDVLPVPAGSESGMIKILKRDCWPSRPRTAQGGGKEYPILGWPVALRDALTEAVKKGVAPVRALLEIVDEAPTQAVAITTAASLPATAPPAEPAKLADWQRRTRDARAAVLAEVDRLQMLGGKSTTAAVGLVVEGARTGALSAALLSLVPIANARSRKGDGNRTLSVETVLRWHRARAANGLAGLVPRESKPTAPIPAWLAPLMTLYRQPQEPSLSACLEQLPAHLPPGVPMPTETTARRWMDKMSIQDRSKGRLGPRAMLALKAFRRRDTSVLEPLDVVVADGHTFRAKWAHPITGKPFQPEVMAVIDAATRCVLGWSAGRAESTDVVMDALRHAVTNVGLFAILYTDNGSGFVNDVVSDELTGYYARLGCLHEKATPGLAQARGLIERPNQSLWRRAAKTLPTYTGRDMDREASKRIDKLVDRDLKATGTSSLLMSWQDGLAMLADTVNAYNNRPHSALAKIRDAQSGKFRHMTPAECLQSWRDRGWEPMTVSASEADDLFRPYERRRTNRCEVSLPWGRYFHRDLERLHGDDVLVGYDIHDGSKVWVRSLAGRLICVAERDANLTPYQPANKVEHGRQKRAHGQIVRRQRQIDDIRVEAAGTGPVLELSAEEAPTPEQVEAAATLYAALEPPAPAPEPAPDQRPRFADDLSWARWLIAHPAAATDDDRRFLAEQLRRQPFRMLLTVEGVDLDALARIAAKPKEINHA